MDQTTPMTQGYGPTRYPLSGSESSDDRAMTRERMLLMAAGVLQTLLARKWLRNVVLSMVGTMVVSLIVRMMRRSQRASKRKRFGR